MNFYLINLIVGLFLSENYYVAVMLFTVGANVLFNEKKNAVKERLKLLNTDIRASAK